MKKFNKNIAKEFKTSFGRFIAIMAIVALGVGFLIGIMQATPDMKDTMSDYYIDNNAYDVSVKGVYGLSEEDVQAVAALDEVEAAEGVISTDVVLDQSGSEMVGRIIGLDSLQGGLNRLTELEGSWPARAPETDPAEGEERVIEVVAARGSRLLDEIEIGDEFTLQTSDATYGDVYKATKIRVVGIVSSPDYYYVDGREISAVGTGVVGGVFFTYADDMYDLSAFQLFSFLSNESIVHLIDPDAQPYVAAYTDCYVKIKGAEEYQRFNEGYKNYVLDEMQALETLAEERSQPLNDLLATAKEKFGSLLESYNLAEAQWLVLDRASTNVSYASFDMNVEKVQDIAGVFPIFFIVVAALVALTSMTRMVEEDRMQIGTFKALGYGKGRIISKYLIYCCLASLIGCVVGALIGFSLLPSIFWQAYGTNYYLPALKLGFSPWFVLIVLVVALAGTAIVTWAACYRSLKERPSVLMQPKAPKAGKRIFLEHIGFIWKPLKFKWKATLRNIFRYKKNMLLTIISVMGCTALILTGFGLNDSVVAVSDKQFSEIMLYDATVEYSGDLSETENQALLDFLGGSDNHLTLYSESGSLVFDGGTENVELYLVEDADAFNSFISLHRRADSAIIDISTCTGAILPENVANVYDISEGDTIRYRSGGVTKEITVCAIAENYTGAYLYMTPETYRSLFGDDANISANTIFVKTDIAEDATEDTTRAIFAGNTKEDGSLDAVSVTSVEYMYTSLDTFEGLESTMGLIIAVLVVSAGALAAIVLYNLTNINIDERRREIATLRVLGYRKAEVAGYIYRESAILTIVGSLLGLGLGFLLHWFIVGRVDSVTMMLGRAIAGWSYLWAFLLTVAFAAIVYAFMLIKLNKINMAESLKSNE